MQSKRMAGVRGLPLWKLKYVDHTMFYISNFNRYYNPAMIVNKDKKNYYIK
jgi:hypothetical protein